jgi:polysaccharide export outer membrane protein
MAFLLMVVSVTALCQQPIVPAPNQLPGAPASPNDAQTPGQLPSDSLRANYVLGGNDQILIRAPQADEINEKPFRLDADGFLNLPLLGRFRAGGLTVQELEADLVSRLREYIREPQVVVTVVQFHSEPVFFVGAFNRPGIYALQGRRTLVEMLSSIGGLQPNASRRIKVTRRTEYGSIPLPNTVEDPEKKTSAVEISLGSLRENVNPAEDIVLYSYDVISAERAELVYISGEVAKVGGIELGERDSISIAQALTMAGGFTREASRDKVRVLRPILNTTRRAEIEIDVKRIFEGKDNDFPLLANDVLYVPRSYSTQAILAKVGTAFLPVIPSIIVALILR